MSAGLIVDRKVSYVLQVKILTTGTLPKENSAHSIILIQMDHNLGRSAPSTVIHLNSKDFVLVNLLCEISLQKFPLGVCKITFLFCQMPPENQLYYLTDLKGNLQLEALCIEKIAIGVNFTQKNGIGQVEKIN